MTAASPPPETTEPSTVVECKNCFFFNPLMAICSKSKQVDSKGFCPDFKGKKTLTRTHMPQEILAAVSSHPEERATTPRIKKAYPTIRKRKKPAFKIDDYQAIERVFFGLMGSRGSKVEKRETKVTQKRTSVFQILCSKKDEMETQNKGEQEHGNKPKTPSPEKKKTKVKAKSKGRPKSPFEILSPPEK